MIRFANWFFLMGCIISIISPSVFSVSLTLEEVQRYIDDNDLDWTAGHTSISKLTDEEYEQLLGLQVPPDYIEPPEPGNLNPDPFDGRASWDWRDHNGVTSVKSQGNCGSCWAFCTTAMVESFVLIYDYNNWDLSEQQLVSCNTAGYGCDGGWIYPQHYMNPGGIFESCMPYQASDSVPCTENSCAKVAFIEDWDQISSSVNSIKNALVDGPVAVAMYARSNFSYYTGGCYAGGSASSVNHGVLIVGYDDADCSGQGAWIVKNSWGQSWGENGFFRIKYGDSNIGYGATRVYYEPQGSVDLAYATHYVDDSMGNNNGLIDPGESVYLRVTLGNSGTVTATGVGATLNCSNIQVGFSDNFAAYPDIQAGQQQQSASPHYRFTVNPQVPGGSVLTFSLSITSNQGSYSDSFNIQMGNSPAPTWTPAPPTNTPIPSWTPQPTSTPYPTNTPVRTFTPMPTWTPAPPTYTPLPTSTPDPSHTAEPTYTPEDTPIPEPTFTNPPANTPTPVPSTEPTTPPDTNIRIQLTLNEKVFHGRMPFQLSLIVDNSGEPFISEQFVALQVGTNFFFWPSWGPELDSGLGIYNSGRNETTLLAFQWPDIEGRASGLTFHTVLCNPSTRQVISNLDSISFGYE